MRSARGGSRSPLRKAPPKPKIRKPLRQMLAFRGRRRRALPRAIRFLLASLSRRTLRNALAAGTELLPGPASRQLCRRGGDPSQAEDRLPRCTGENGAREMIHSFVSFTIANDATSTVVDPE